MSDSPTKRDRTTDAPKRSKKQRRKQRAQTAAAPVRAAESSRPAPAAEVEPTERVSDAIQSVKRRSSPTSRPAKSKRPADVVDLPDSLALRVPAIVWDGDDEDDETNSAGDGDAPSGSSYIPVSAAPPSDAAPLSEIGGHATYFRPWTRSLQRPEVADVDDYGRDPNFAARLRPGMDVLYKSYFRAQCTGSEHVPAEGATLIVANRGGALPWDGLMLGAALRASGVERELRWLLEDFVFHFPYVGVLLNRMGAVRACQENAQRLLESKQLVAAFPEGAVGVSKRYADRYKLQRFGRGGYVKLAIRTGATVVPAAIVGSEETNPLLFKIPYLSKALGLPFVPITPTFPMMGPVGLAPLPVRWRITFGKPIDLSGASPEDPIAINRINEQVRATIQSMLDETVRERGSAWL